MFREICDIYIGCIWAVIHKCGAYNSEAYNRRALTRKAYYGGAYNRGAYNRGGLQPQGS